MLADKFGWTYEYIDDMPYETQIIIFAIMTGQSKAQELEKTLGSKKSGNLTR